MVTVTHRSAAMKDSPGRVARLRPPKQQQRDTQHHQHSINNVRTWKGRQGGSERRRQASPWGPARQRPDVTKPAIRRLARRGGVKRISGLIYEETRGVLKTFMGPSSVMPSRHRARPSQDRDRCGRRVRHETPGPHSLRLRWLSASTNRGTFRRPQFKLWFQLKPPNQSASVSCWVSPFPSVSCVVS